MNEIRVTKIVEKPYHSGAGVYLNIDDQEPLKLSFDINRYARIQSTFDNNAAEFAYFCAVIYGCDRAVARDTGDGDRWTREVSVEIPVSEPTHWQNCVETAETMLEFLTGDIWHLSFIQDSIPLFGAKFRKTRCNFRSKQRVREKAVSLFSGGLDSLAGAVDWLEANPSDSLILASSYDAHAEKANSDQVRLLPILNAAYPGRVNRFVARSGLLSKGKDLNFRSRSLTFLGNAVLAASFIGEGTTIEIPENGAIALNYPLAAARSGSFSTRTVHPYFIKKFNALLRELGFNYKVENPYQLKTKGEVLTECRNLDVLQNLYEHSVSCGKRGRKMYWNDRYALACGHCVPCIFRQASVHAVGFEPENYGCTVADRNKWGKSNLLKPNSDLQTVIDFIQANLDEDAIWRKLRSNGHLEREQRTEYVDLILRLRAELRTWLASVNLV